ncbi:MAG: hypothetical protein L6R39_002102 [Caloplaca ligustica]|nr:MAG: hypothetical protein L6R39_002102 [Caloplaca ligustica]
MPTQSGPLEVLFIGSSPFQSTLDFLTTATQALPTQVQRLPDGETGARSNFIAWQHPTFPITIVQPRWGGQPSPESAAKAYTIDDIKPTGYDEQAIRSYAEFRNLKDTGRIPPQVRFQVCLPTPLSVVRGFVEDDDVCAQVEPLYETRLLHALHRIQDTIPPSELAIQWDLPTEVALLEYERGRITDRYWKPYYRDEPLEPALASRLARLAAHVKPETEIGFHFCYGDLGHVHFVQPEDMGVMVMLANLIVENVAPIHEIAYMHMPVPKEREDERYFAPLKTLSLHQGKTKLYLGVVHAEDEEGEARARRRLEAAKTAYPDVAGIASECGLGRTAEKDVKRVLETYASLTRPS